MARTRARPRARVSLVPSPLYILAEVAQKLTSKLPGDGGRKKVSGDVSAQREIYSKLDFPKTLRRYTNFSNKGNYIVSDFPGQPKTLFARTFPTQNFKKVTHVMLCYVMLCYVMLRYVMLCYAMYCYAMLCYAMLCYAMLCYGMLCYDTLCYV